MNCTFKFWQSRVPQFVTLWGLGTFKFSLLSKKYFRDHFPLYLNEKTFKFFEIARRDLFLHLFRQDDSNFGVCLNLGKSYLTQHIPVINSGCGGVAFLNGTEQRAIELYVKLNRKDFSEFGHELSGKEFLVDFRFELYVAIGLVLLARCDYLQGR